MEAATYLKMAVNAPKHGFLIAVIVTDDNSTMRAHLKHPHVRDKKGKLPLHIYSPEFFADPSHRKKFPRSIFMLLRALQFCLPGSQMILRRE